jgi:spore maturation protein CgeB
MNFLYIGPNNPGSTSGMRSKTLQQILQPDSFTLIDTSIPFFEVGKIYRSLGFRYKVGPFIWKLNKYIQNYLTEKDFDIIWIDKASFIGPLTTQKIKQKTKLLIHFTPDTAFFHNRSSLFEKSMKYYDHFISTKSYDLDKYPTIRTMLVPQGFDPEIHRPYNSFEEKTREVSFIGLYEPYRGEVIRLLLDSGICVTLAGKKWGKFRYLHHPNLEYLGEGLFGDEYARIMSSSLFGLGLLSKRFPELHTTRTFEIPACGTALITEENEETRRFFEKDEAIFFKKTEEIPWLINQYKSNKVILNKLSSTAKEKVVNNGYSYPLILKKIIDQITS